MKKISLDPDLLVVDSFEPAARNGAAAGTVLGNSYVSNEIGACSDDPSHTCVETDWDVNTCGISCQAACFATGNDPECVH